MRNPEADIKQINSLRQRVKAAATAATEARVQHNQAQADLERAREASRELGVDIDDPVRFDEWFDTETKEVDAMLKRIERNLSQSQEAMRG